MILDVIYILISLIIKIISVVTNKSSIAENSFKRLSKRYLDITQN